MVADVWSPTYFNEIDIERDLPETKELRNLEVLALPPPGSDRVTVFIVGIEE